MFKSEHGKQGSLVCELCSNKENKTSREDVVQRCCRSKAVPKKKKMCQPLFDKVVGCKIFSVSFSVDFSVNFVFLFHRTALSNCFCK